MGDALEIGDDVERLGRLLPRQDFGARAAGAVGGDRSLDLRAFGADQPERFLDQHIGAEHALAVGLERMGFDQHGRDAREIGIAGREARAVGIEGDALVGIAFVDRSDVHSGDMAGAGQGGGHCRAVAAVEPAADVLRMGVIALPAGEGEGDVILIIGAVGDVEVEIERRPIFAQQPDHRPHLGRVGFEIIAVEVEVLGGGAPALRVRARAGWGG